MTRADPTIGAQASRKNAKAPANAETAARPGPTAGPGVETAPAVNPGSAVDTGSAASVEPEVEPAVQPLLLHSLVELREVWLPLLNAADARSIVEIGSESGVTTSLLAASVRRRGEGTLVVVDPEPGVRPDPGDGLAVQIVAGYSPEALDGLAAADAYLVDGDHNYATVSAELAAIAQAVDRDRRPAFPLVVLHDVEWPAGRRDQYYAPERIPAPRRRSYTWDEGVKVDVKGVVDGGFRGAGAFAWATSEGGPRNGVRTAIEDFLADRPELSLHVVPAIFGLGVIIDRGAPWATRVRELIEPWSDNAVLGRMERNRIGLYLRVLELQDEITSLNRVRQRDWSKVDAERSALAERELVMLDRVAELERSLAEERRTGEALRADLAAHGEHHGRPPLLRRR